MWGLLILIIILFISFNYLTKPYLNPYKTIMMFGKKGSGKSTLITKKSIIAQKHGRVVYSNIHIPGNIYFNPKNFVGNYRFIEGSDIHIDEVGMVWDKRDFAQFDKKVRDFFKLARHYKCTIYLYSQTYDDVDKKIRDLTDELYIIKKFMRVFTVALKVRKVQDIGHTQEGHGSIIDDYRYCGLFNYLLGDMIITFIPRWVHFFDSFITNPNLSYPDVHADELTDFQKSVFSTKNWLIHSLKSVYTDVKGKTGDFFKNCVMNFKKILSDLYSSINSLQLITKIKKKGLFFDFVTLKKRCSNLHLIKQLSYLYKKIIQSFKHS